MLKLYEYQSNYHRTNEALNVRECGQGIYIGVNSIVQMPNDCEDHEQTTSIVIPLSEVKPFVEAILQSINKDAHVVLKLTGTQLKTIIEALDFSTEVLECEINKADMPYDLIETLKAEFEALLERDKLNNKKSGEPKCLTN